MEEETGPQRARERAGEKGFGKWASRLPCPTAGLLAFPGFHRSRPWAAQTHPRPPFTLQLIHGSCFPCDLRERQALTEEGVRLQPSSPNLNLMLFFIILDGNLSKMFFILLFLRRLRIQNGS